MVLIIINDIQAAERVLVQSAGLNMNTWIVGHAPIGHHIKLPHFPPVEVPGQDTSAKISQRSSGLSKSAFKAKLRREGRERDEAARAAGLVPSSPGVRTFFMKGRIMAGQANLEGNLFGLNQFMWLTKKEIEDRFTQYDFDKVKDMLAER